jgi:hypothetical protein
VLFRDLMHGVEELLARKHAGLDRDAFTVARICNERNCGEKSCGVDVGAVNGTVRRREAQTGHDGELYFHAERDDSFRLANDVQLPGRSYSRLGA